MIIQNRKKLSLSTPIFLLAATVLLFSCNNTQKQKNVVLRDSLKQYSDSYNHFMNIGNYVNALEYGHKKMYLCKLMDSSAQIANTKLQIAGIYGRLLDNKKAINLAKESAEYFKANKDSAELGNALSYLSAFYGQEGNLAESKKQAQQAIEILKGIPNVKKNLGSAYNQLACCYSDERNFEKAIELTDSAINNMKLGKEYEEIPILLLNSGYNYLKIDNAKNAEQYLLLAKKLADSMHQTRVISGILFRMAELYELKGDYKLANTYVNEASILHDSLISDANQKRATELEVQYKVKDIEFANTKLQLRNKRHQLTAAVLVIFAMIVAGIFITISFRNRRKLTAAKLELANNKKSLDEYIQTLISKNEQIAEWENRYTIETNKNANEVENNSDEVEIKTNAGAEDIIFNFRILTKEDWENFKIKFDKTFPSFIIRIREKYSELTSAEERHLLLIKANLNSQEIAKILGIGIDSVKKSRQRLRKRLNIGPEIDLEKYIKETNF